MQYPNRTWTETSENNHEITLCWVFSSTINIQFIILHTDHTEWLIFLVKHQLVYSCPAQRITATPPALWHLQTLHVSSYSHSTPSIRNHAWILLKTHCEVIHAQERKGRISLSVTICLSSIAVPRWVIRWKHTPGTSLPFIREKSP